MMSQPFSRPILAIYATSMALAGALFAASPALAQSQPGSDRMNMVIIYGNDECPPSKGDEITVCARKDESERYRIPAPFRDTSPKSEAWTNRVIAYESVGATGAQSCSPVGAGGWTGCEAKFISNGMAARKQSSDVQFSKMIEAEREKRLSKIDAQAAATQADVEQAEKDYDARKLAQQKAEATANTGDTSVTAPGSGQNTGQNTGK